MKFLTQTPPGEASLAAAGETSTQGRLSHSALKPKLRRNTSQPLSSLKTGAFNHIHITYDILHITYYILHIHIHIHVHVHRCTCTYAYEYILYACGFIYTCEVVESPQGVSNSNSHWSTVFPAITDQHHISYVNLHEFTVGCHQKKETCSKKMHVLSLNFGDINRI